MQIRRASEGYVEFELEEHEYHLVLRIPELNFINPKHLRRVGISFLMEDLTGADCNEKNREGGAVSFPESPEVVWPLGRT